MLDKDRTEEYLKHLIDRYTACELVELLDLSTEDIVDRFYEEILEQDNLLDADRR